MTLMLFAPALTPTPFQRPDLNSAQPEPLGSNVPDNVGQQKKKKKKRSSRVFVWFAVVCPEATVVWMWGLARMMHSAGFMGFSRKTTC